eukprot:scaffold11702_cov56-Cylindrotheca_fusiformis.AAC.2
MTAGFQPISSQIITPCLVYRDVREYETQECGPHDVVTRSYTAEQIRSKSSSLLSWQESYQNVAKQKSSAIMT